MAPEPAGPNVAPENRRAHLLEIDAAVVDGILRIVWTYGAGSHHRATIERLARQVVDSIRALIESASTADGRGYTPSDFPLASLDTSALDRLTANGAPIEDVYPLTPAQEGILFHALYTPGPGEYVLQLVCGVQGKLDIAAFEAVWQHLIERHAVLRTAFAWPEAGRPVQVVYRGVALPLEVVDLRGTAVEQHEEQLDNFLGDDRARGFDPTAPPLTRLTLFRLGDESFQFVWTYHHLLLDGWCLQVILQEMLALYQGASQKRLPSLPVPPRFRDYVAWMGRQDHHRAEPYWRALLKGVIEPIPLGIDRPGDEPSQGSEPYDEQEIGLSAESTRLLGQLAARNGLTLSTVVHGAWAILLGRYSGRDDVVFGATLSGRAAAVEGIESIVGLLINTLPVRASIVASEPVLSWLSRFQSELLTLRQYESTPLWMVQGWSEVPRGKPLFESLLVFENYPIDAALGDRAGTLGFGPVRVHERTHFPLTVMAFPGTRLRLRVSYDTTRFDASAIDRLLGHLGCLLDAVAAGPETTISSLPILSSPAKMRSLLSTSGTTLSPARLRPRWASIKTSMGSPTKMWRR